MVSASLPIVDVAARDPQSVENGSTPFPPLAAGQNQPQTSTHPVHRAASHCLLQGTLQSPSSQTHQKCAGGGPRGPDPTTRDATTQMGGAARMKHQDGQAESKPQPKNVLQSPLLRSLQSSLRTSGTLPPVKAGPSSAAVIPHTDQPKHKPGASRLMQDAREGSRSAKRGTKRGQPECMYPAENVPSILPRLMPGAGLPGAPSQAISGMAAGAGPAPPTHTMPQHSFGVRFTFLQLSSPWWSMVHHQRFDLTCPLCC